MHKKVLSETVLYYGDVSMPKGFEINQEVLSNNILQSKLQIPILLIFLTLIIKKV